MKGKNFTGLKWLIFCQYIPKTTMPVALGFPEVLLTADTLSCILSNFLSKKQVSIYVAYCSQCIVFAPLYCIIKGVNVTLKCRLLFVTE